MKKFCFSLFGPIAMFSDPILRQGGERTSYPIPTYEALCRITEKIHWKPTLIWYIDAVRIIKPIRFVTKTQKILHLKNPKSDLVSYTYLQNVEYQVLCHYGWNNNRPEFLKDRIEEKHSEIFTRNLNLGGKLPICLGTNECTAYVKPCEFSSGEIHEENHGTHHFGLMFYGFSWPGESGKNEFCRRLWMPKMIDGIIEFPQPKDFPNEERSLKESFIRQMLPKKFDHTKQESVFESYSEGSNNVLG